MFKIRTLNNISVTGLDRLPRDKYEVASEIRQPDGILLRSYKMHEMELPDSLEAIGRAGAGVNNIPIDRCNDKGIVVFNAPGANANAVKELVIAGMLIACRNIGQGWQFAQNLEGDDATIHKNVEAGKKNFVGFELQGRTLGVVGLGAIGVKVANVAIALGMNVIGYDPTITVNRAWQLSSQVQQASGVDALLNQSDFITFHVPLNDKTKNMITAARLEQMKTGAIFLNFARDGILNDQDVVNALDAGKVYAYVCDFPSNLLKNHPRVVTLPHLGASTKEAEENCAIMVADQIKDYLENGNILNSVNFPDVQMPRSDYIRVAIVNRNIPHMLSQITTALAEQEINIMDTLNKSRGEIAYTLLDIESEVSEATLDKLRQIDGILRVRLLG